MDTVTIIFSVDIVGGSHSGLVTMTNHQDGIHINTEFDDYAVHYFTSPIYSNTPEEHSGYEADDEGETESNGDSNGSDDLPGFVLRPATWNNSNHRYNDGELADNGQLVISAPVVLPATITWDRHKEEYSSQPVDRAAFVLRAATWDDGDGGNTHDEVHG